MTFNYKKSDVFMIGLGLGILLSQAALALAKAHDRKVVRKQADKILRSPDQHHDLKDTGVNDSNSNLK